MGVQINNKERIRREEFALFCQNLGGSIDETGVRCVIPLEDVKLRHNKFIPVERGDLSNVVEVAIEDEESFKKSHHPRIKKKYQFTTTMGDPDPDHLNWYAVLERVNGDDVLTIVQRKRF